MCNSVSNRSQTTETNVLIDSMSKYEVHMLRYLNNILYSQSSKITIDSYVELSGRSGEQFDDIISWIAKEENQLRCRSTTATLYNYSELRSKQNDIGIHIYVLIRFRIASEEVVMGSRLKCEGSHSMLTETLNRLIISKSRETYIRSSLLLQLQVHLDNLLRRYIHYTTPYESVSTQDF